MLDEAAASADAPPAPSSLGALRVRRNAGERSGLHSREWPGSREFPVPEPDKADVKAYATWKADKLRFEMNVVAATAYNDDRMTEAEVNLLLYKEFRKRLPQGSIWKLVDRCTTFNPQTKRVHGFWACIPRYRPTRLRELNPLKSSNSSHQLSQLFRRYPHIEAQLVTFIVKRTTDKNEMRPVSVMEPAMVWDTFLALCKAEGLNVAPKSWPFTHKKHGYEAIRRWYHDKKYINPSAAALNELNEETAKAVRNAYRGIGISKVAGQLGMAYSRTELDEHMFDAEFTMFIPGEGEDEWIAVHQGRLYFLVHIECESEAVLAADVALNRTFTGNEVKMLVHDALVPPPKPASFRLKDPEWQHAEGACFPAELPEFERCTWQVLAMDRALQHRAGDVRGAIKDVTGCQIDFDKPAEALSRRFIEGFFKFLARFARWLESATGNHPDSPSRRDSEGGAVRSRLTLQLARELLQLYCRNYNVTKRKGTGKSPIDVLQERRRQDRCYIGRLGEYGSKNLYKLLPKLERKLSKRVSRAHGPVCIYLGYEYYLGPDMSSRHELMTVADKTVDVYIQRDARFGFAVPRAFPDVAPFEIVVCGPWATEPHTLEWRMHVKRMAANGWFADHGDKPLLGFGAARALGRAAKTEEGLADLLSGYYLFADQYGRGEVQQVNMTPERRAQLLAWIAGAEVVDVPPSARSDAESDSQPPVKESPADTASTPPRDLDDAYGILKD